MMAVLLGCNANAAKGVCVAGGANVNVGSCVGTEVLVCVAAAVAVNVEVGKTLIVPVAEAKAVGG
jgi:hypothetical protein